MESKRSRRLRLRGIEGRLVVGESHEASGWRSSRVGFSKENGSGKRERW